MMRVLFWLIRTIIRSSENPRHQTHGSVEGKAESGDQKHSTVTPIIAELQIPQSAMERYKASEEAQDKLESRKFRLERNKLWIEGGTLAVIILGTVGAFWNLVLLRKSIDEAKRSADAATIAATSATNAATEAQRANGISEKAIAQGRLDFKNAQRAWLSVDIDITPAEPTQLKDTFRFRITPAVTGPTPALSITGRSLPFNTASGIQPPPKWESLKRGLGTVVVQTQKGRYLTAALEQFPNQATFDAYVSGTINIAIWNEVSYCDVFQRLHWIRTCAFHVYGSGIDHVEFCGQGTDTNDGDQQQAECKQTIQP